MDCTSQSVTQLTTILCLSTSLVADRNAYLFIIFANEENFGYVLYHIFETEVYWNENNIDDKCYIYQMCARQTF